MGDCYQRGEGYPSVSFLTSILASILIFQGEIPYSASSVPPLSSVFHSIGYADPNYCQSQQSNQPYPQSDYEETS